MVNRAFVQRSLGAGLAAVGMENIQNLVLTKFDVYLASAFPKRFVIMILTILLYGYISFYNSEGVGLMRMRRMILIVVMVATNCHNSGGDWAFMNGIDISVPKTKKAQRYHSL